nr:putative O-glycosylation ligase, exosortase A system-associated [Methylomarinum sp. Ch1-1]MDP4521217.1 putative O-glycosylation ligase, exosortase A system-associated [Methylomarinum sp. Ch1-1]
MPAIFNFMPESWHSRMSTIQSYENDASAMGRINAWWMAYNLAKDNFFGGGYECFIYPSFVLYAPNPRDAHDAHSIYFEVLGEHGFIGLSLFLLLGMLTLHSARKIIKEAKQFEETKWMSDLAAMLQVSLIGYAASGAFLGLAYFDLYYHMVAIIVICKVLLSKQQLESSQQDMKNNYRVNALKAEI